MDVFWHGHNCRNTKPKDNKDYWDKKIGKNIQRDNQVTESLIKKGWFVIRLWECELKNEEILKEKLATAHNFSYPSGGSGFRCASFRTSCLSA